MLKRGEVYENPVTGERVVIRVGTHETGGERLVADIYARPGAAVAGEHVHPSIDERFTVLRGKVGFCIDGREAIAKPGHEIHVPAGVVHDWWNAGDEEAHIVVEVQPAARFEAMILNLFGLAQDGKTDKKGMPFLLQLALLAREFEDVVQFTSIPRPVQRVLFALLAPIARLRGYRGRYPEYESRAPVSVLPENALEMATAVS